MNPSAILHICLSTGWGGLEMYPVRIGQALLEANYPVYGLCVKGTPVAKAMQAAGITTFEVASKTALITLQILALKRWLTHHQVKIVHCHKSGDVLIAALLNLLDTRRVIFTEHMGVKRPKKDWFHRWVYSCVNQVLSISNETYQRNLNALPVKPEKIAKLWLGTHVPAELPDQAQIRTQVCQELGIKEGSITVGSVGRLGQGKGQLELVQAFHQFHQQYPTSKLIIVGGLLADQGADVEFVAKLKRSIHELKLTESVILTGFRRDTARLYCAIDVICLPYYNEAFGLTSIEAMAAKKAIIAANTGALPEILSNTALYCDPKSPSSIALQMAALIGDRQLSNTLADKAYQRAQAEFSNETHLKKLLNYYFPRRN
jgi:glycosyltransferase involved in cell wall biosynthesis